MTLPNQRAPGFGTELVTRKVPYELSGSATLDFGGDTVTAQLRFPLAGEGNSIFDTGSRISVDLIAAIVAAVAAGSREY